MNTINIVLYLRQPLRFFESFDEYCFQIQPNLELEDLTALLSIAAAECYDNTFKADVYCNGKTYCTIDLYTKLFKDEYTGLLRISKEVLFKTIENDIRKALENDSVEY